MNRILNTTSLAALALSLSACGGGSSGGPVNSASSAPAPAAPVTPAPTPTPTPTPTTSPAPTTPAPTTDAGSGSGSTGTTAPAPAPTTAPTTTTTPAPTTSPAPTTGSDTGSTTTPAPTPAPTSSALSAEYKASAGVAAMNASYAYDRHITGGGVILADIDTGIDLNNSEFAGRISADSTSLENNFARCGGCTAEHVTYPLQDTDGHGTATAAVMAGAADGKGIQGVAPGATILAINVEGPDLSNVSPPRAVRRPTGNPTALSWDQQSSMLSTMVPSPSASA